MFGSMDIDNVAMVPLEPSNVSGASYPVSLNITGDTRFYDYKQTDKLDLSGLINENISNKVAFRSVDKKSNQYFLFPKALSIFYLIKNGSISKNIHCRLILFHLKFSNKLAM